MIRKEISSGHAIAAAVATVVGFLASAQADVENIYFNDFNAFAPAISPVNDGALFDSAEPFLYNYSGNDGAALGPLQRRVGFSSDGVGGTSAAFLDMDSSQVKTATGNTWWYAGVGRYVYVDSFVGAPYAHANQVSWTVDAKGDGLSPVPQDPVTMRFAVQRGGGLPDYWAGETSGYFDSTYNTIGGTLDQFTQVGGDSEFSGIGGFIAQLQPNTGAFGNDAGNRMTFDNFRVSTVRSNWKGTANNALDNPANWSESTLPNGDTAFPIFRTANGTPQLLTLNSALVVNRVDFDTLDPYTISGTGSITIRGNSPGALVDMSADRVNTINAPVTIDKPSAGIRVNAGNSNLILAGGLTSTGAVSKDRNGQLTAKFIRTAGALNILGGQVTLQLHQTTTSKVAELTFAAAAGGSDSLELNDARLIVDYSTISPLASLKAALTAGKIKSSLNTDGRAIVIAERTDFPTLTAFGDLTPDATSVLIVTTLKGDSNLSQTVNFDDLLALAQSYGTTSGAKWSNGDSNGDGAVSFDDLLALAQNYNGNLSLAAGGLNGAGGSAFAADFALAQSLVPEPTSLAALGGLMTMTLGRRRK